MAWDKRLALRRHLPDIEIVLRRHAKSVGDAIEEGEHGDNVNRLADLIFSPRMVAQLGNIVRGRAVRSPSDDLGVFHQGALRRSQASLVELALQNCRYALIIGS